MKNKKQVSLSKVLLYTSLLINMILLGIIYVVEKQVHFFGMALERRNIITLDDQIHSDYWARAGWTNTIKKLHIEFDVAFFGNSLTRGSDFQTLFPDKKIINLGYPGDNMTGMLRRIPMLQAARPKKIFIMAGTNDLAYISLEEYKDKYIQLIEAVKDSIPNAEIFIESVLPSNHEMRNHTPNQKVQKANAIAQSIVKKYRCTFINLYDLYTDDKNELNKRFTKDGLHLYPKHYDKWAAAIKPLIYK